MCVVNRVARSNEIAQTLDDLMEDAQNGRLIRP